MLKTPRSIEGIKLERVIKQTWAKPTGPHPEGRPVFSEKGKRISIAEVKGLIDAGGYEPSPELKAWFAVYYRPVIEVELSIIESNKIADLKKRKKDITELKQSGDGFYDEQLQLEIQDAEVEYHARCNKLMNDIATMVLKKVGVEL